ncbi:MAG: signal transduction histidine kinase [Planctomycetota bacterium]|jgi:signal transduction histidine kinase
MNKLMQGTQASANRYISISITDDSELLYEDSGYITHSSVDIAPDFTEQVKVDLYGREWVFEISTNLNFGDATTNNQPLFILFILFGGIAIDLMLLMLFVSTANRKALGYADQITEDLNLNAERLLKSNNELERFAYIASHDLKSPLNAIKKLAGWVEDKSSDCIPDILSLLRVYWKMVQLPPPTAGTFRRLNYPSTAPGQVVPTIFR